MIFVRFSACPATMSAHRTHRCARVSQPAVHFAPIGCCSYASMAKIGGTRGGQLCWPIICLATPDGHGPHELHTVIPCCGRHSKALQRHVCAEEPRACSGELVPGDVLAAVTQLALQDAQPFEAALPASFRNDGLSHWLRIMIRFKVFSVVCDRSSGF